MVCPRPMALRGHRTGFMEVEVAYRLACHEQSSAGHKPPQVEERGKFQTQIRRKRVP
jgi:hypothetical protein